MACHGVSPKVPRMAACRMEYVFLTLESLENFIFERNVKIDDYSVVRES